MERSFDQQTHSYLGYCLQVDGKIGSEMREFSIAIGKAAHQKHQFCVGDEVSGESVPVPPIRSEFAEFYKTSKLTKISPSEETEGPSPPDQTVPPDLETYRRRGHRRLAARTYEYRCFSCIWGCRMPVTIIVDQWNPDKKKFRFETFCYGPKSCWNYRPGPQRRVLGRKGMTWEEPDWVDEDQTAHRGPDE